MNKTRFTPFSHSLSRCAAAVMLLGISSASWAATDVLLWHSLPEHNKKAFEKLISDYNRSQDEVQVKLKAFANEDQLEAALKSSDAKQLPHVFQFGETHGLDDVAKRSYVQPLYNALNKSNLKNEKWFIPSANNFMHDAKGRMVALPYMAEVPVMFYNVEAFKKAGLNPAQPSREWQQLQDQLVTLANNGSRRCPLTSDQPVSINLENLAAVNKQFYAGDDKGGKVGFNFDSLYIRHLATMISWVRSEIMVKPEFGPQSVERFANGECAVLLSNSGNIGRFKEQKKLDFSLTGIPYYPQVTKQPGNPFVAGSGLWLTKAHAKDQDATLKLLSYLSSTPVSEAWYQQTGYLPLTQQAFAQTQPKYYQGLGDWQKLVAVYEQKPENTTRGFKVNNYHQIRALFNQTIDNALAGNQSAMTALNAAAAEANKLAAKK